MARSGPKMQMEAKRLISKSQLVQVLEVCSLEASNLAAFNPVKRQMKELK